MSVLNIYKASAGSGKTYRLAGEYLKMILREPYAYRYILAVTFTNKATEEMKNRILEELEKLAKGEKSGYIDELVEFFEKSSLEIQKNAKQVLHLVLHDYSRFSVSTIDTFFQKVIRAFTREISLHASFETELDEQRILDGAIDRLLLRVEKDTQLKDWLVNFAEDRMEEGKNWNLRDDIGKLGRQVFREAYKGLGAEMGEKLSDKAFLGNFLKALREIRDSFEKDITEGGKEAVRAIEQAGYGISDFSFGKTGIAGYLYKLADKSIKIFEPGKRVLDAGESPDKWLSKAKQKDTALLGLVANTLHPMLCSILDYIETHKELYYTTEVVLSYFYTLGILHDLSQEVRAVSKENNVLLLSDSNYLLKGVIGEDDAPFIYEKIGNRYTNYMIDEFQDTSNLQWQNFRPLVGNALAGGDECMVVGDVKQSIYRWRNGDWKLLASQLRKDFDFGDEKTLEHNWRSDRNIIDFNNTFFHYASGILQEGFNNELTTNSNAEQQLGELKSLLRQAYFKHFQKFPHANKARSGMVDIQFIDEKEVDDWKEDALEKMIGKIEQLQDQGVALKDIAILVRSGYEGQIVAEALLRHQVNNEDSRYRFDVISNDSLFVESASTVRFILQFLQFLVQSENNIAKGFLLHEYEKYIRPLLEVTDSSGQISLNFQEKDETVNDHSLFARIEGLPEEFSKWFDPKNEALIFQLQNKPLYELVELVIKNFRLDEISCELPFLQAFLDKVLDFSRSEQTDAKSFLLWWEQHGSQQTINVSEQQDAIRVLTIHKSKGLQFKTLLIPFCDWELFPDGKKENILWCKPEVAPFNQLSVIPVKYSSKLANTIFYKEYFNEKFHSFVDNLNLLYVAFTRAESVLWACAPLPQKKEMKRVKDLLSQVINECDKYSFENQEQEELLPLNDSWDDEKNLFHLGEFTPEHRQKPAEPSKPVKRKKSWSFEPDMLRKRFYFGNQADNLEIKQHSEDYFILKDEQSVNPVNQGRLIHSLFERMKNLEDLQPALKRLQFEGLVNKEEAHLMEQEILKVMKHPFAQSWFDGSWRVLNEQSILLKKEAKEDGGINQKRPDRVMMKNNEIVVVDYKSGEYESQNYMLQVKGYMLTLKDMGYENVKGYVWYLRKDKIVEVE